ncbi:hypothetical protein FRC03_002413, partial [Tulasnella sp. 419]
REYRYNPKLLRGSKVVDELITQVTQLERAKSAEARDWLEISHNMLMPTWATAKQKCPQYRKIIDGLDSVTRPE